MLKLTPILLAALYGFLVYRFSAWRTARTLKASSAELADARLRTLAARLAEALEVPRIRVFIYEIPQVNGLAAPDGQIYLTRGFYDRYRAGEVSAEEMTSVIAHELGHVALGHARRRMIDFSGQNALRAALMMVLGRVIPGLGPWLANALIGLISARLSRSDEYEADAYAAALMTRAGLGTGAQKSLLSKLEKLAGGGGGMPAWLLSHPKSDERVRAIEALEARWRASDGAPG